MPTQPHPPHPAQQDTQQQTQQLDTRSGQVPGANGTKRRPGPPKPVTFTDFASI